MNPAVGVPGRAVSPWTGARGYVWRHGDEWLSMLVDSHGIVVNVDDSHCWELLMRSMHRRVGAVRMVEGMGQTLRPWADLVEEAGDGF